MVRLFGDMAITKAPYDSFLPLQKSRALLNSSLPKKHTTILKKQIREMVDYKLVFGSNEIPFQNYQFVVLYIFKLKLPQKTFDHHRMFVL